MKLIKTSEGHSGNSISYKPKEVRRLVGIDSNKYDYWKKALELESKEALYDGDVLAYKIIKQSILGYRFTVSSLKQFDWKAVFLACNEIKPESLITCRFVFDLVDNELLFLGPNEEDPSPRKRLELCPIYMNEVFEELYEIKRKWHPRTDIKVVDHEEFKIAKFNKLIKGNSQLKG